MNKHNIQAILKWFLFMSIALSSGCTESTLFASPTSTPEAHHPKGKIIYSTVHSICWFDIESETTNIIFSTKNNLYYSFVVQDSIYFSMGDVGVTGDIFKINLDGSDLEQLTFDEDNFLFSVSSNGDYLAYSDTLNHLFILDIQTKKSQLVFEKDDFGFILGPWSPDGKKFFFTERNFPLKSSRSVSPALLYSLEDKSTVEFLPAVIDFGFSSLPTWLPDGKSIALNMATESQSNDLGICILNIETKSTQEVALGILADKFEWSPNGSMLVYESRTEPTRLYLFDIAKKETKIIYDGQTSWYSNYQLWSPDSNYIAYFSIISGSPWQLNIHNIDSGEDKTFEVPPAINGAIWLKE
jgi:Tol biopolymer transport system component